ncbi:MAG: aldo/keto reductase [Candidatus Levybacteria bacterium RIFCSPHIGHO2_12_FULL_38_12]|nr:MAG: aldo/keto reductase [Candidatus Levybacteria bacterium RIFCSPHIGHO2_12_FULL_38_12]
MKYRRLGRTNFKVSEVGMGTWQIADDPEWGKGQNEKKSFRNLQHFIDLGGNNIDTAWVYGWREDRPNEHLSEELIGRFLKKTKQRDKIILITKIPPLDQNWPAHKGATMSSIFPKKHILQCIEDSLRGLQTDTIDLMLFHVWRDEFNEEDEWKKLCLKLTKEGKVKFWGLSPNYYEPSGCLRALESGIISVVQCIFNIFHQKPITELFSTVKKLDVGIMACAPLDEGGLTGKITLDTKFENEDFRTQYFVGKRLIELVKRTDKLKELLGDEARTLPELALRFILSFGEISTVIPGMRNIKNIDANMALSDGRKLTPTLIKKLQKYTWERNFYPWVV